MPPSESMRWVAPAATDEVDDYISSRRARRARRAAAASAGLDVLDFDAEFAWDSPAGRTARDRADDRRSERSEEDRGYRRSDRGEDELSRQRSDRDRRSDAGRRSDRDRPSGRDRPAGTHQAGEPAVVRGVVFDEPVADAWRAAAAARHVAPQAHERSLDEWGDRVARISGDGEPAARRTVLITGRGAERYPAPRRSYSASLRRHQRAGFKPDRVAMWAFVLALALLLGAVVTSSHAAVLVTHAALHLGR